LLLALVLLAVVPLALALLASGGGASAAESAPAASPPAASPAAPSTPPESVKTEGVKAESAKSEGVKSQGAKAESAKSEGVKTESVKSEGAQKQAANPATGKSAPARPAAQATPAEPAEEADSVLGPEPATHVRVEILNATGKPGGANKVALLLAEYARRNLEDRIGMQIEVVNVSSAESERPGQSIVFYRPEFLRAALAMAKAIPGEQFVEPMRPAGMKRAGVDVEIVVGRELP
jgi:hypothetical protein